jgi:adenosylmethionine-8-amino-7-oxononanoate aminotransferase
LGERCRCRRAWLEKHGRVLTTGSTFVHGHTYQGHPMACVAALRVQQIIQQDKLLANVEKMGKLLSSLLVAAISHHPHVGDIRGRGLFWGIEFVQDKCNKQPFKADVHVAMKICDMGLSDPYSTLVYPCSGTVDGILGDHIILAPSFNVTEKDVQEIVQRLSSLINDFFANMDEQIYLN